MSSSRTKLFYDEGDFELLKMVNRILDRGKNPAQLRKLFDINLHPRGIKELAAPKSLRIASAMIDLLGTFEEDRPEERLVALRAVRSETLHESSHGLRHNAARVLMQIMKEIVRARGDEAEQLALAHDFREASSGKPRLIRKQLRKYHLLEMPEQWNQLAFDHHVHDANTKGRKSPTHLIMDAWIKGIRFLRVIYYGFVDLDVAVELLEAAEVMGIDARIGVELFVRLYDKPIRLVWTPRSIFDREELTTFLEEPAVKAFMARGRVVAEQKKARILAQLRTFNDSCLAELNDEFQLALPPLDEREFLTFVGPGQASLVHLAEFAHASILPHLDRRVEELRGDYVTAVGDDRQRIRDFVDAADQLVPEVLVERCFRGEIDLDSAEHSPAVDGEEEPTAHILGLSSLLDRIEQLPCRSSITLNPSNLNAADVLEILYEGGGRITHLEIFNSKDWAQEKTEHRSKINQIRLVINSGSVVDLKRLVRDGLHRFERDETSSGQERAARFRTILRDIPRFLEFYRHSRLRSRLGSDSIGRSRYSRGMGLVVIPTLPRRARRRVLRDPESIVPVVTTPLRHTTVIVDRAVNRQKQSARRDRHLSQYRWVVQNRREVSWTFGHNTTTLARRGNIASLGGLPEEKGNGFRLAAAHSMTTSAAKPRWGHLNTGVLNIAKIIIGFIPAFLTFYLTNDWWLLAYFGAIIWFSITGLRNILQSVVGGGGLFRSSLLGWNDFVSWSRVADSLLFTGFSVPLLDFFVKNLVLARGLDITTTTNPILLYSIIALANGIYISSHNLYRGLPAAAIFGNFFRTILSIPLAVGINFVILQAFTASGESALVVQAALQLWAAVISKAASDTVAAIIEGSADRRQNLLGRMTDYREKLEQIYATYGRLEMVFPDSDVQAKLENSKELVKSLHDGAEDVLRLMVISSLDLLYFWMYQPRAETALNGIVQRMSVEETKVLAMYQRVLSRKRVVSGMLLDGLVGKRFEKALEFYLAKTDAYLDAFAKLAARRDRD